MRYLFKPKIFTLPVVACIALGAASAVIWRLSLRYVEIADFFSGTISFALRFVLSNATRPLPF